MWDWIKNTSGKMAQAGMEYLNYRQFTLSLLNLTHEQAYSVLREKIFAMDDTQIKTFYGVVTALIQEAQQSLQQAEYQARGGGVFEDQVDRFMANYNAGFPVGREVQQAQMVLQGLVTVAQFVELIYQERAAQPPPQVRPITPQDSLPLYPPQSNQQTPSEIHIQNQSPPSEGLDDMQKAQLFMDLQKRHLQLMPNIMPGKAVGKEKPGVNRTGYLSG
jgi:hypothetical protein